MSDKDDDHIIDDIGLDDSSTDDNHVDSSSDDDYLEYVYQTTLGRSADQDGKDYWLGELDSGHVDRDSLMEAFSNSAEGKAYASHDDDHSTDDDYLEYVYQTALGRSADQDGKDYWLGELDSGHVNRDSLMEAFSNSAEGKAYASHDDNHVDSSSDDDYLEYVYQTALGRSADQDGKDYWLGELDSGHVDRDSLMEAFSNSAEGKTYLELIGVDTVTSGAIL